MSTALLLADPGYLAEQLTGRSYLSWSQIETYRSCPAKYRFRYIDRFPEETVSAALVFGGGIHAALQLHFEALLAGEGAPGLDMLLDGFWTSWHERDDKKIRYGKNEDVNSIGQLADRMLRAFQASPLADPGGEILGVEEELRGSLAEDTPDLLGRVDLLVETRSELVVVDYKTARSRWSREQVEGAGEQLLIYGELIGQSLPERPIRLEYRVITKAKDPATERYVIANDPSRMERTKCAVQHVWRGIEAAIFFPAPSAMNCPGCPFREACARWVG